MSEQNPILDGFVMGEAMTDHNGVVCYPAMLQNSEDKYIVKKILVPANHVSMDALLLSGAYSSREDALAYYQDLAGEILQESRILTELSTLEGFVPYQNSHAAMREDGNGYAVCLVAPYRTSLEQIFSEQIMTHQGILDLAMDLCTALAACRRAGYLYIDLKPSNIFFTENKDYRIGDLGFIALSSLRFASLQDKYKSIYTAPEIEDAMSQLNTTLDVYALGLILYQAYNGGHLPLEGDQLAQSLLPPVYADYEMAEIILTALHPEVSRRWQDPTQLGQALVQYMQRNGVSPDPIIPAPVATPELDVGEEFLPEEAEITPEEWEEIPDLDIFQELDASVASEDPEADDAALHEMLAQADDLIAHVPPAPAVAPDPIDVPMPEPIQPEPEAEIQEEEIPEEVILEEPVAEEASAPVEEAEPVQTPAQPEEPVPAEEEVPEEQPQEDDILPVLLVEEPAVKEKIPHPKRKRALRITLILLILAMLVVGAYLAIRNYRQNTIRTVHSLTITGTADSITVLVDSDLEENQMQITCSDAYGNTQTSNVVNGIATFTGLNPQTRYTIRVTTTGKYKLHGTLSDTFTTDTQTMVSDLTATIGPADGSVYLSFRVTGVECDAWILTWSAPGLESQSATFAGHSYTVYDLQIGSHYTFTLSAGDESNVVGQTQVEYTAQNILRAEQVRIIACGNGVLTVQWESPAGADVKNWTITCRDESGFHQTIVTDECIATFQGMDHLTPCTIEIVAEGMPQGVATTIGANPLNITDVHFDLDENGDLLFVWDYTGTGPENGWMISWSCDGYQGEMLRSETTSVALPFIPRGEYTVSLIPADGIPIFGHTVSFSAPETTDFAGFGITADDLTYNMCAIGNKENWSFKDIDVSDYRHTFTRGENAGFVLWHPDSAVNSQEEITITYVLRNYAGALVDLTVETMIWDAIWSQNMGQLTVPYMPQQADDYCLWIYINNQLVLIQEFIVE